MTDLTIELKNYKTFHGHDGNGWQGSVYVNGKRVGVAVEDGWGGPLQVHLDNKNAERSADLLKKAVRSVEGLPSWEEWGLELDMSFDTFITALAGVADLRKLARRKVLLRNNSDPEKTYTISGVKPKQLTDETRQRIEAKFEGKVLNGTDELVAKQTIQEVTE